MQGLILLGPHRGRYQLEQRGQNWGFKNVIGGGERDRTDDLLRARQTLSQLSYTPKLDCYNNEKVKIIQIELK